MCSMRRHGRANTHGGFARYATGPTAGHASTPHTVALVLRLLAVRLPERAHFAITLPRDVSGAPSPAYARQAEQEASLVGSEMC